MPTENARQTPQFYACYKLPEIKALLARMVEMAAEIRDDLPLYSRDFSRTLRLPDGIFQQWHNFCVMYERFLSEVITREQLPVACSKGCAACCHVIPQGLEPLEIISIYQHVHAWEDFTEVLNACAESFKTFQEDYRTAAAESGADPKTRVGRAMSSYYQRRIPCAFLDSQAGICRIYDIRPIICRAVFSVTDPEFCDPRHPGYSQRQLEVLEPVDEINFVLMQINMHLSEALGFRFPDLLAPGLLAWHNGVRKLAAGK